MTTEIPLSGGNVADGVVRVEETVRKPQTPFDPAINALLERLADAGVAGVPRYLGLDAKGRRKLSWVPGTAEMPANMWEETVALETAAQLLRAIHDASQPLVGSDHSWAYAHSGPIDDPVIGHSDFAPYNMTFESTGAVQGVFDFDLAGPAPRSRDLAYLAWWMVPLGQQEPKMAEATARDLAAGSPRLAAICATYGLAPDTAFLDMIASVLRHMADQDATAAMIGFDAAEKLAMGGHFAHWQRAAVDFQTVRPQISANLGRVR